MTDLDLQIAIFMTTVQGIMNAAYKDGPIQPVISRDPRGKKYARIVKEYANSKSVYCFIDLANGDILKADGWKRPARGARGNIFDEASVEATCGPYGCGYIR